MGEYDANSGFAKWNESLIKWRGNKPPKDRSNLIIEKLIVHRILYFTMCIMAVIGVLFAIVLVVTNLFYRNHR